MPTVSGTVAEFVYFSIAVSRFNLFLYNLALCEITALFTTPAEESWQATIVLSVKIVNKKASLCNFQSLMDHKRKKYTIR